MMPKVMLDAGHGIETPGKRSFDGSLREYEFNRDVAKRMKTILERHGLEVILTCPSDNDVSLENRVALEHKYRPDILVSIHANAYGTTWNDARGWEIYISASGGNREVLAKKIKEQSIPFLGVKDRGIKVNLFYVLKNTYAPAVLIEHEFYTNKEGCELLKSSEFREKCALANSKGILSYFGILYREPQLKKEETKVSQGKLFKIQVGAFSIRRTQRS